VFLIERIVKSREQVAAAEVVVAGLFAATVLRHHDPFEPHPTIVLQHRQRCASASPTPSSSTIVNLLMWSLVSAKVAVISFASAQLFTQLFLVFGFRFGVFGVDQISWARTS
jgi:hypothetical protein